MAAGSTIYRLTIDVSDIDEGVYHSFPLQLAQHPSEDKARLVARGLAYCLLAHEAGLAFGKGLDEPDEPALATHDETGRLKHWIDIGAPSAERLHRASKAAEKLTVVCHRGTAALQKAKSKRKIFSAEKIIVWELDSSLVDALAELTQRGSQWSVIKTGFDLMITVDEQSLSGQIRVSRLSELS